MRTDRYNTIHQLEKYNPRAARTIRDLGFKSVRSMCLAYGLHIGQVFDFLHGRIPMRSVTGEYSGEARKLAAVTGCIPEDFAEDGTHLSWRAEADLRTTGNESNETWHSVLRCLQKLCDRDRNVIQMTFLDGMTLGDVGQVYGISGERVRQIRKIAIRKLNILVHKSKNEL